ncbi:PTS sugar transporter subunit IIB, partial [Enterococcus durans]|nr:PTS sugar transporter subunit IIB [Enterococcus durans]
MKILLACSAGMSTSLLVNNMKKFADASDVIEARPVRTVPDILDDWDVLLLGPQVRY